MLHKLTYLLALPLLAIACSGPAETSTARTDMHSDADADEINTSAADGDWVDLFNGEDFTGWHKYGGDDVGSAWEIRDGAMYLNSGPDDNGSTPSGGDLVTEEAYANYELELDWKISDCGNSGIIYNVQETDEYRTPWMTGPEMQIVDNACHPDAKIETHRAGDLYDLVSVKNENVRPAGEWNNVKLVVTDGKVEQWLNGEMQVAYNNTGEEWEKMIAGSKFKNMENWGMFTEGKISLQDHGDPVWFRNIRIRELSK